MNCTLFQHFLHFIQNQLAAGFEKSRPPLAFLVAFVVVETLKMLFCNHYIDKIFWSCVHVSQFIVKYFNCLARVTAGIFPENKLFIHGWTYFNFFIGINSRKMLNKVTVWFVFIEFKSAIHLPSCAHFANIFLIIWFFLEEIPTGVLLKRVFYYLTD